MRKKGIAILLACLLMTVQPISVSAGQTYSDRYFYYEKDDGAVIITGYFGKEKEVTIPSSIAGNPVSVIAEGAFVSTTVEVLYLPDTIMEIEENAIGGGIHIVMDDGSEFIGAPTDYDANVGAEGETDGQSQQSDGQTESSDTDANPTMSAMADETTASDSEDSFLEETEDVLTESEAVAAESAAGSTGSNKNETVTATDSEQDNKDETNPDTDANADAVSEDSADQQNGSFVFVGVAAAAIAALGLILCYRKTKRRKEEGEK